MSLSHPAHTYEPAPYARLRLHWPNQPGITFACPRSTLMCLISISD